jgi:hypothetical protein
MYYVVLLLIFVVLAIVCTISIANKKLEFERRKISFRESMNLAELPVITFYNGKRSFNFLLDSGSNDSHIDEESSIKLTNAVFTSEGSIIRGMGDKVSKVICRTKLTYKDCEYDVALKVTDLKETFDFIKKDTGVQLDGILGSKFFKKYRYVLDFAELVAYYK